MFLSTDALSLFILESSLTRVLFSSKILDLIHVRKCVIAFTSFELQFKIHLAKFVRLVMSLSRIFQTDMNLC